MFFQKTLLIPRSLPSPFSTSVQYCTRQISSALIFKHNHNTRALTIVHSNIYKGSTFSFANRTMSTTDDASAKRNLDGNPVTDAPPAAPVTTAAASTESTSVASSSSTSTTDNTEGMSAAKKQRIENKPEGENTDSYMGGGPRSKVRGKIRGADKYKGRRNESRNAEIEAARKAKAAEGSEKVEGGAEGAEGGEDKEARIPKRKVALMMGYCGTGYQGMQVNPNAKTIEGDLFQALIRAGAVSKDNSDDIKKVSMMRSARTDKGVHAAGNVVSLKMIIDDMPDIVEKINKELPDQIRLFGFVRTVGSFNARVLCDSRVYEYMLPSYVFLPRPELKPTAAADGEKKPEIVIRDNVPEGSNAWDMNVKISTKEEMEAKRAYRIEPETLALVREGFKAYEGTSNFHNFTIGKSFKDRSCQRFMMSFKVSDPKIIENTEWLSLKVHGQSFMLHQIRKMVGLIIMCVRTGTPLSLIPETFKANKINIPKAPALGLLLERPAFATYNRKIEKTHDALDFSGFEDQMEAFKEKFIYDKIIREEQDFNRFDEYLQILDANWDSYNFGYLNKEGTIPESAIIARGDTLVAALEAKEAEEEAGELSD